jgi:hypothetical protein
MHWKCIFFQACVDYVLRLYVFFAVIGGRGEGMGNLKNTRDFDRLLAYMK